MYTRLLTYIRKFDRNLWILSFGWFVSALGFAVAIPFIAIYFHSELGLSLSQIGYFFGGLALVRSLFQAVGGEISDRMERRQLMIMAQAIRSVAFVFLALSIAENYGFWAIAACMVVASIFGAIFQPAANAMVSDILPKNLRLEGYAITRASGNLGWAVGPALGGFMAASSYSILFLISAIITLIASGIFWLFLKSPVVLKATDRFKFKDLLAIVDQKLLAWHCALIFVLYLVVAQLIATFSVYAVNIAGISETELGYIYSINGLFVVLFQIPVTRMMAKRSFTGMLALGSFIYAIGYGIIGFYNNFWYFILAIMVVTVGEMVMSPPSLALTSKMAPEGRMGRFMGIYGFFVASGWSFGPLYGGLILDHMGQSPPLAWIVISSLALVSGFGYLVYSKYLPRKLNYGD